MTVTIERIPGKQPREILDARYVVKTPANAVVATFGNSRDADTFVSGWNACAHVIRMTLDVGRCSV